MPHLHDRLRILHSKVTKVSHLRREHHREEPAHGLVVVVRLVKRSILDHSLKPPPDVVRVQHDVGGQDRDPAAQLRVDAVEAPKQRGVKVARRERFVDLKNRDDGFARGGSLRLREMPPRLNLGYEHLKP